MKKNTALKEKWVLRAAAGRFSENTIKEDLKSLIREGRITRYRKSDEKEEGNGVDFFVTDLQGIVIPLQVKSNSKDQPEHIERYPLVPSISPCLRKEGQRKRQLIEIFSAYAKGEIMHLTQYYNKPVLADLQK